MEIWHMDGGFDDVCFVRLNQMRPHANKLKYFVQTGHIPYAAEAFIYGRLPGEDASIFPEIRKAGKVRYIDRQYQYASSHGVQTLDSYFSYDEQVSGTCGSLILIQDISGNMRVLGIHVASTRGADMGVWAPITRESLERGLRESKFLGEGRGVCQSFEVDSDMSGAPEIDGAECVARIIRPKKNYHNALKRTPISGEEVGRFRLMYAPSPMCDEDLPGERTLVEDMAKHVSQMTVCDAFFEQPILDAAVRSLADEVIRAIQSDGGNFAVIMADDYECWNGSGRFPCLAPIDATTHAGLEEKARFGGKGKANLKTGDLGSRASTPEFKEMYVSVLQGLIGDGEHLLALADVFPKGEFRKILYY
jgi:hypothetical protein